MKSIDILIMLVLGGLGNITGSIIAAVVLTIVPELLRGFAEYRMVIYSILLILVMIYRPDGLLGGRSLGPARLKNPIEGVKAHASHK